MEKKTHIAVVSIPAYSHQVATFELCKRLVQHPSDLQVTFIIPTLESLPTASKAIFEALPSAKIDSIFLPIENLPPGIHPAIKIQLAISRSMPFIHDVLKTLSPRLVALIDDYSANEAIEFAKEFNILSYIYFPLAATVLSLCLYSQELDEAVSCDYKDLPEPIQIPGCIPIHGRDLPNSLQNRSSETYKQYLQRSQRLRFVDGILVNSFVEMEGGAIRAMQEGSRVNPPVYPVGPIVQTGSGDRANGSECLRWLEKQPPNSVLYISFGSGGTLCQEQLNELALGLEFSGQKFLWVLRAPSNLPSALYFSDSNEDPLQFLPSGFLERTKEHGLVIPSWAPQVQILSHNSTGGFLTQCGWFSILESIFRGVPLIAWPLFAEQRMNAALLSDGLKVAIRPKVNENGIVKKEEIATVIKTLMEDDKGKEIRMRVKHLQDAAAADLKEEGSSTKILSHLVLKWKNLLRHIGKLLVSFFLFFMELHFDSLMYF